MADRPQYYPLHDVQLTNLTPVQLSLFIFTGYPSGLPVPSSDHNGKLNSLGGWTAYADQCRLCTPDWLATTTSDKFSLSQSDLTYQDGGNITTTGGVVATRGVYLLHGTRLETDDALLNPIGQSFSGSPLKFVQPTLPGRVWVYVSNVGDVRIESVGPVVSDSPAANEMTLTGHEVDAIGRLINGPIAPITDPLPAYELGVVIPLVVGGGSQGALTVSSTSPVRTAFIENTGMGSAVVVEGDGTAAGFPVMSVDNTSTGIGMIVTGDGGIGSPVMVLIHSSGGEALTVLGNTTLGAAGTAMHMFNGTVDCPDNVSLGTSAANTLQVNSATTLAEGATIPASKTLTLTGNADISGGIGSTVAVQNVDATSVDTLSLAGIVKTGEVDFYPTGIGTFGTGVRFDGGGFAKADAGAARRLAWPIEAYVAGDINTAASINDTGAEIDITLALNEVVKIEYNSEMTNDGTGERINFRIEVDGSPEGGTATRNVATAGVYVDVNRVIKFTATAAASYNIKARYGAIAGTTTARNILLTVTRSLP